MIFFNTIIGWETRRLLEYYKIEHANIQKLVLACTLDYVLSIYLVQLINNLLNNILYLLKTFSQKVHLEYYVNLTKNGKIIAFIILKELGKVTSPK